MISGHRQDAYRSTPQPLAPSSRSPSGQRPVEPRPRALVDVWFAWQGLPDSVELALVAIGGTIAGAFPQRVDNGERFPIHRKFLPDGGRVSWFLRVAAGREPLVDLRVWLELRDPLGNCTTTALSDPVFVPPGAVHTIQRDVELPRSA